jgi:hypothetical protein
MASSTKCPVKRPIGCDQCDAEASDQQQRIQNPKQKADGRRPPEGLSPNGIARRVRHANSARQYRKRCDQNHEQANDQLHSRAWNHMITRGGP